MSVLIRKSIFTFINLGTKIVNYLYMSFLIHIETVNTAGQTPLFLAYANRHKSIVKYLVDICHCNPKCKLTLLCYISCLLVCTFSFVIVDCLYLLMCL